MPWLTTGSAAFYHGRMKKRFILLLALSFLFPALLAADANRPLAGLSFLLDPGHGGNDPGAVGPTGLTEADTNLRVARYLGRLLTADGATVHFTRTADTGLSLGERVARAETLNPDLFVSIHHNASLKKMSENRGEIFFNALDFGTAPALGREMNDALARTTKVGRSLLLPGGFYVLRNNPAPAILTEGSYISIPLEEKALKSGRALTEEALALHQAIRRYFADPPIRLTLVSGGAVSAQSQYITLLVAASGPIRNAGMDATGPTMSTWRLNALPMMGHVYALRNVEPLTTGAYTLRVRGRGDSGKWSTPLPVKIDVSLPIARCRLDSVAPYLPVGFQGTLPLRLTLLDDLGRPNQRSVGYRLDIGGTRFSGRTEATATGAETLITVPVHRVTRAGTIDMTVQLDDGPWLRWSLPARDARTHGIIGRITSSFTKQGLADVLISYGSSRRTTTDQHGYFWLEWPRSFGRMRIDLTPPPGYAPETRWLEARDRITNAPEIVLAPNHPTLMNKRVAIMTTDALLPFARSVADQLNAGGAKAEILPLQRDEESVHRAVNLANKLPGLDFVWSFKDARGDAVEFRHYHRGGRGLELAKFVGARIQQHVRETPAPIVGPGSDYELGHCGASTLVIALPPQRTAVLERVIADGLFTKMATP